MRRILAVIAGSRPTAWATFAISMSGSRASAMMSVATRDELGKSTWDFRRFSKSWDGILPRLSARAAADLRERAPKTSFDRQLAVDSQYLGKENTRLFMSAEGYPSGQRGQTVNLLAYAFVGSIPTPSTTSVRV